jgi:NADH:ubiquinone oxidoreductase subunit E
MERIASPDQLEARQASLLKALDPKQPVVRVCMGPGCLAQGAGKVSQALKAAVASRGLSARVQPLIKETGCHGFCSQGTLVSIAPADLFYVRV